MTALRAEVSLRDMRQRAGQEGFVNEGCIIVKSGVNQAAVFGATEVDHEFDQAV